MSKPRSSGQEDIGCFQKSEADGVLGATRVHEGQATQAQVAERAAFSRGYREKHILPLPNMPLVGITCTLSTKRDQLV